MGGHKFSADLNMKRLNREGAVNYICQEFNYAYAIIRIMNTEVGLAVVEILLDWILGAQLHVLYIFTAERRIRR
jgi:hypothetical protein